MNEVSFGIRPIHAGLRAHESENKLALEAIAALESHPAVASIDYRREGLVVILSRHFRKHGEPHGFIIRRTFSTRKRAAFAIAKLAKMFPTPELIQ